MKKIIYSFILVLCTVISVMVIRYFDSEINDINREYILAETDEAYVSEKIDSNQDINEKIEVDNYEEKQDGEMKECLTYEEEKKLDNIKNDTHVNEEINSSINTSTYIEPNNNSSSDNYINSNKNINNKYSTNREVDDLLGEDTVAVFKVNKNTIPSKISSKDKLKMLKMANSLSVNDYKSVAENIKRSDELAAATDIFFVLKNKLSSENYKELKKILTPYIDIDLIEKNINKK